MISVVGVSIEKEEQFRAGASKRWEDACNRKEKDKRKSQVKQYTLDGKYVAIYPTVNEAAKAVGVSPATISGALNGHQKSSAGFMWRRAVDPAPVTPCIINTTTYPKTVEQYTVEGKLVKTYPSICKAAKGAGVNEVTLRKYLNKDKIYRQYYWKTID